jgi:asparagine synthetase B (glutamine-hydrolysing)
MCGIAGVIRYSKEPITEETVGILLVGNEHRGNDASGIIIQQNDGTLDIYKKDLPGWRIVSTKEYEEFVAQKLRADSSAVIVHTRGASKGNPRDNNNNHPMFAGAGAIVHNGVIKNDDTMFSAERLIRKAATDSDIIRAIVDREGITEKTIKMLGRLAGSGAIAAVHPEYPGLVLLGRSGNPLNLACTADFLMFSSEKDTLHKASRPWFNRFGIWFQDNKPQVGFSVMADDTAWILGPKGLQFHGPMKINNGGYKEPWRKTYEEYETRQKKWNDDNKPRVVVAPPGETSEKRVKPAVCAACKKEWVIPFDGHYKDFNCNKEKGGCGKGLFHPGVLNAPKDRNKVM